MSDSSQPFAPKKFLEIKGKRMACIDEGEGAAIVFQHGNPWLVDLLPSADHWPATHGRTGVNQSRAGRTRGGNDRTRHARNSGTTN
jgi:hypothetical protein